MGLTKQKRSYTDEEVKFILDKCDNKRDKALFSFLYLFGCRRQEALNMKRQDVRTEENILVVRITVQKRKNFTHEIKVSADNVYAYYIIDHIEDMEFDDALFSTFHDRKKSISGRNALRILTRILPDGYIHRFRDTRLNKLVDDGATEFELQTWAGWSDTRPAKYYVQASSKRIEYLGKRIT